MKKIISIYESKISDDITLENSIDDICYYSDKAKGKELVLFIGPTGAGKSTAANYLNNRTLVTDGHIWKSDGPRDSEIGHSQRSETTYPQIVDFEEFSVADCPGTDDSRGFEASLVTTLGTLATIKKCEKVKKIVIFIPYYAIIQPRTSTLLPILSDIGKYFGELSTHYNDIGFVITHAPEKISKDGCARHLIKKIEEITKQQIKAKSLFDKRFKKLEQEGDDKDTITTLLQGHQKNFINNQNALKILLQINMDLCKDTSTYKCTNLFLANYHNDDFQKELLVWLSTKTIIKIDHFKLDKPSEYWLEQYLYKSTSKAKHTIESYFHKCEQYDSIKSNISSLERKLADLELQQKSHGSADRSDINTDDSTVIKGDIDIKTREQNSLKEDIKNLQKKLKKLDSEEKNPMPEYSDSIKEKRHWLGFWGWTHKEFSYSNDEKPIVDISKELKDGDWYSENRKAKEGFYSVTYKSHYYKNGYAEIKVFVAKKHFKDNPQLIKDIKNKIIENTNKLGAAEVQIKTLRESSIKNIKNRLSELKCQLAQVNTDITNLTKEIEDKTTFYTNLTELPKVLGYPLKGQIVDLFRKAFEQYSDKEPRGSLLSTRNGLAVDFICQHSKMFLKTPVTCKKEVHHFDESLSLSKCPFDGTELHKNNTLKEYLDKYSELNPEPYKLLTNPEQLLYEICNDNVNALIYVPFLKELLGRMNLKDRLELIKIVYDRFESPKDAQMKVLIEKFYVNPVQLANTEDLIIQYGSDDTTPETKQLIEKVLLRESKKDKDNFIEILFSIFSNYLKEKEMAKIKKLALVLKPTFSEHVKLIAPKIDAERIKNIQQRSAPSKKDEYCTKLKKNLIGQEDTIQLIASLLGISRSSSSQKKPFCFLFVGPSGTGKTYLAKNIARIQFPEHRLARIDCNQLGDEDLGVNKLSGFPASYKAVTEDDWGLLGNSLKPFIDKKDKQSVTIKPCVILLDEFEKAHNQVWNCLMTLLDEGYFITGKEIKLTLSPGSIIIATSNFLQDKLEQWQGETLDDILKNFNIEADTRPVDLTGKIMSKEIRNRFKIIPFKQFSEAEFLALVNLEFKKFKNSYDVSTPTIPLIIEDSAKELLVSKLLKRSKPSRDIESLIGQMKSEIENFNLPIPNDEKHRKEYQEKYRIIIKPIIIDKQDSRFLIQVQISSVMHTSEYVDFTGKEAIEYVDFTGKKAIIN
ncbi:hypothetical protein DID76_02715 [Candidatus Marinamargulisbacteria bacterium SCGC AG-414-C22]|nr:hypothetical protein DID76_02715 [Candidatus Marinamargulisbacteria bacterium SCGC AG-414-C22]